MLVSRWWLWSAGLVGVMMVVLGVGNLIEDDGGPLYGRILFAAALIAAAALIGAGIRLRPGRPQLGSRLVGIGTLPGATAIAFFWSPPAVALGVLALATSITAFRNADGLPTAGRTSLLVTLAAALGAAVLAVGVA